MGAFSRKGAISPHSSLRAPFGDLLSFFALCFLSCVLASCCHTCLVRAVVHFLVLPIRLAGTACFFAFRPRRARRGEFRSSGFGFPYLSPRRVYRKSLYSKMMWGIGFFYVLPFLHLLCFAMPSFAQKYVSRHVLYVLRSFGRVTYVTCPLLRPGIVGHVILGARRVCSLYSGIYHFGYILRVLATGGEVRALCFLRRR